MAQGGNFFLYSQNQITDGTVRTFRQTGFGAGCFYRFVGDFGMACCCNLAGFKVIAVVAIPAFLALFGTSGSSSHCPVTEAVAGGVHVGIHEAISAAAGVRGITLFCTGGGCYDCFVAVDMIQSRNHFRSCFATAFTGECALALSFLGGFLSDSTLVPVMTQGRYNFLFFQNSIADRAVFAFCQAGSCTGRCNCCIDDFRMAGSIHIGIHIAGAAAADVGGVALLGTGGGGDGTFIGMGMRFFDGNIVGQGSCQVKRLGFIPVFEYKSNPTIGIHQSSFLIRPGAVREITQIVTTILIGCLGTSPLESVRILKRNDGSCLEVQIEPRACPILLTETGRKFVAVDQFRFCYRFLLHRYIAADMGFHDSGNHFMSGCIRVQTIRHIFTSDGGVCRI